MNCEKGYTFREKKLRNRKLIEFRQANPDLTTREVGKIFNISHARVCQITKPKGIDATKRE